MFPDFYVSFNGFCFDVACSDENLDDEPDSPENNVKAKVLSLLLLLSLYQSSVFLLLGRHFCNCA